MISFSTAVFWAILIAASAVLGSYYGVIFALSLIIALIASFVVGRKTRFYANWNVPKFFLTLMIAIVLSVAMCLVFWKLVLGKAANLSLFLGGALSFIVIFIGSKIADEFWRASALFFKLSSISLIVILCISATYLLGAGPDALSYAAKDGNKIIVRLLLLTGHDKNARGRYAGPPLVEAAMEGHAQIVKILLAAGADTHLSNANGATALTLAAGRGNVNIVKALLNAGADPNEGTPDGWTPLMQAAYLGKFDDNTNIVKLLLDAGANPSMKSKRGETAISIAENNRLDKIVALLKRK